jgi:hypothetical protein
MKAEGVLRVAVCMDPLVLERPSVDWWLEQEAEYKVVHTVRFYVVTKKIVFIWAILCFVSFSTAIEMDKRKCFCPFYPDIQTSFHSTQI